VPVYVSSKLFPPDKNLYARCNVADSTFFRKQQIMLRAARMLEDKPAQALCQLFSLDPGIKSLVNALRRASPRGVLIAA